MIFYLFEMLIFYLHEAMIFYLFEAMILYLFVAMKGLFLGGSYWIGLSDRVVENYFVWDDGTPVMYTNWNSKEPNNWRNLNEDCVSVWLQVSWVLSYIFTLIQVCANVCMAHLSFSNIYIFIFIHFINH